MSLTMKWCLVVLFLVGSTWADNSIDSWKYKPLNCIDLKAQEDLALDKIMGKWYVVEILEHKPIPEREFSSRVVMDRCPIIRLRRDDESHLLRLLWTEEEGNLEYTFRVPNSRSHGLWISISLQNGTLMNKKNYTQFTGSVHVMKAVAQHIVLTFCSGSPDYQLWSILMGREHLLERSSINGIHGLLTRRHLKISNTRATCAKGTGVSVQSKNSSLFFLFIILSSLSILPALLISDPW